jgi:hypothetical protein
LDETRYKLLHVVGALPNFFEDDKTRSRTFGEGGEGRCRAEHRDTLTRRRVFGYFRNTAEVYDVELA